MIGSQLCIIACQSLAEHCSPCSARQWRWWWSLLQALYMIIAALVLLPMCLARVGGRIFEFICLCQHLAWLVVTQMSGTMLKRDLLHLWVCQSTERFAGMLLWVMKTSRRLHWRCAYAVSLAQCFLVSCCRVDSGLSMPGCVCESRAELGQSCRSKGGEEHPISRGACVLHLCVCFGRFCAPCV